MSANINTNLLAKFIAKTIGADKLSHDKATGLHIDDEKFEEANDNSNLYLEIDEILEDNDLYSKFATMFEEEQDKKANEEDEEKKKEENNKVKDKNGAGV